MIKWIKESTDCQLPLVDFSASRNQVIVRNNEHVSEKVGNEIDMEHKIYTYDTAFMSIAQYLEYTKTLPTRLVHGVNRNGSYTVQQNGEIVMHMIVENKRLCIFPHQFNEILSINAVSENGKNIEFNVNELGIHLHNTEKVYVYVIAR